MNYTHGKCEGCKVIFRWSGWPRLKDAACPRCGANLARTAANLNRRLSLSDEVPLGQQEMKRQLLLRERQAAEVRLPLRLSCGHLLVLRGAEARAMKPFAKPGRTAGCEVCKELGRTEHITVRRIEA